MVLFEQVAELIEPTTAFDRVKKSANALNHPD